MTSARWILLAFSTLPAFGGPTPCERLVEMKIPTVTIRGATMVPAGRFSAPGSQVPLDVPAFCRVEAVAHPVPDSEIEFEVWIPPVAAWNGKFEGVGNGGYVGAISYPALAQALRRGFAAASHNTGHVGDTVAFGLGHPEKVIDYGHRAVHVMTENAKLIVRVNTGRFADRAYFAGCSAGGHQALALAQRYPADYDGIVAGAPANNRVRQTFGFLWSWMALHREDGSVIVDRDKLATVSKAVVEACDAADGIRDGVVDDPRRCAVKLDGLLSASEARAVRKMWEGAKSPATGKRIYTGWPMGSENFGEQGWASYLLNPRQPARVDVLRFFLFDDPNWDFRTVDWDRDLEYANEKLADLNAVNPDLGPFKKRGGKLVMYSGWLDPVVPPGDAVAYYEEVTRAMGGSAKTRDFARLFMVPGMGHCAGGPGPNRFDALGALEEWVEKGKAPDRIIATHATQGAAERTRPLCPYPLVARPRGSGSTDDAANFACVAPPAK